MSLKERMRLEQIESDSLLRKPQWFVKEEESEAEVINIPEINVAEDTKTPLCK